MAENSDIMIKVTDATVRFNMASEKIDNLKEYFVKLIKRELMFQEFLALKDVNFEVKRGEAWGLIGTNGSGKSTLLKLICGILKPYKGTVDVYGSIAPLIELGAGFDGELTATENIYLNGAVLGYSKEFMDSHYDEIVDFAELKDFMNMPIKNYSSGMAARLGFAIATIVQPEILIVDDGSKDDTAAIADEYAEKYPTIVKAIHQENGGHGEAVNAGIRNATGLYFKVVDSDDWVNPEAYQKILNVLAEVVRGPKTLDLLISNYVYEKEGAKRKRVMRYAKSLPEGRFFGWDEAKALGKTHYLLMHSLIYRTSLLRECGMKLPEHTFYVDNLVAFIPLPYVKTMYYLDVNFYRYFIGRADQSVNEKVMIGRIDQQIRVNKLMIDYLGEQKGLSKYLRKYMISYLTIIMTVSSVMMMRSGTEENLEKKNDLWRYLKQEDAADYFRIRHGIFGTVMSSKSKPGQKIAVYAYKVAQKLYGFN